MKTQAVIKYVAAMVLLPATGFAVVNSVAHLSPAFADTLASSSSTVAQNNPNETPTKIREWRNKGGNAFRQLNLTTAQQAQIKSIREQSKSASQGLRQQLKTAHGQLRTLLASNDASDSALLQAQQQVQSLSQQMSTQRFETMLKVRDVLTPAQRTQLSELRQQGRRHRHAHHRHAPAQGGTAS